jgi:hypothetical protein
MFGKWKDYHFCSFSDTLQPYSFQLKGTDFSWIENFRDWMIFQGVVLDFNTTP